MRRLSKCKSGAPVKIKVCGITNIEDALFCEVCGADALGYVFYPESKRYIDPEKAAEISRVLSPLTMKVGVFVNATAEEIYKTFETAKLNLAQLHGDEPADFVNNLKVPAIKVFHVDEKFNYDRMEVYNSGYFLLDTRSAEYGGTGSSFNWSKIPVELRDHAIIAGGVSASNVEKIFHEVHPYGVDVSSSLESSPGKKDKKKVEIFFKTIRNITC
jgi:phosphoribosylanthranilate isomerase